MTLQEGCPGPTLLGTHQGCLSSCPQLVYFTGRGEEGGLWSTGGRGPGAAGELAGPGEAAGREAMWREAGRAPPPPAGDGRAINLPVVMSATGLEQEVRVINQGLSSYDKFIKQMNL